MGRRWLASWALAGVFLQAGSAHADDSKLCADSYENAQRQRTAGKLQLARAQLLSCRAACPGALLQDCSRWLAEVEALIPKVQVAPTPVEVREGDRVLSTTGKEPIELDPGDHELSIVGPGGETKTVKVTLPPGSGTHKLSVKFASSRASSPEPTPPGPAPPPASEPRAEPVPTLAMVLGGVGAAALVTGGVLAALGHLRKSELEESCSPDCADSDVDGIRRLWLIGGVAAAIGAVSLGGAVWVYASRDSADTAQLWIGARF
jgi:hypothetical protein